MPFDLQPDTTIAINVVGGKPSTMEEIIAQYWRDVARHVGVNEPLRNLTCEEKNLLHRLTVLLRTPEDWPQGFVWSYTSARTCALGLAMCCFECSMGTFANTVAWPVFGCLPSAIGVAAKDVTPEHVAAAFDKLLGAAA